MSTEFFMGLAVGLYTAQCMVVGMFLWRGQLARRQIRKTLDEYEQREREKRGL